MERHRGLWPLVLRLIIIINGPSMVAGRPASIVYHAPIDWPAQRRPDRYRYRADQLRSAPDKGHQIRSVFLGCLSGSLPVAVVGHAGFELVALFGAPIYELAKPDCWPN